MTSPDNDIRLNEILDMIGRLAALDFSKTLSTDDRNDMVNAISLGLNMLAEELQSNVVEKSKLDVVNSKLEKFAYTTAHDLKSPINSVVGLISLMEIHLQTADLTGVDECIRLLKKTTDQMKNLVQGILDYSRADSGAMVIEKVSLEEVAREIIESDRLGAQAAIFVDHNLPCVLFNKPAMNQVIRNLLTNAVKFSNKADCTVKITSVEKPDVLEISVSDNGPGIAPTNHGRIFELFNNLDSTPRADSHGIGLATVRSVLESFGERIWVDSVPGHGATFTFTLNKSRLCLTD